MVRKDNQMTNEEAAFLNAQNCQGQGLDQYQWGLCPQVTAAPDTLESLRAKLRLRAEELRRQIANVDVCRAELDSIEKMLEVDKAP
jgi:hypothetical protein